MKVCPTCQLEYPEETDFCPADGMKLRARRDSTSDPLLGRALDGRWIIEEKLGEGGMGAVYRGHQRSVNRTVAIKTLRPQLVESDEFVNRFFREAQIAANIAHPHCVTILDYGEDSGTLYLAMEFLDGELLTDRIEAGTLTAKEIVEIGIQTASALSAAHDQNIVHRDLKPDNIYLLEVPGGGTFVKVLDFGIAKMLDSTTQVTKTGMIFGTPEYMSPEQCRGDRVDGRSDLYSLGCILYELIGGRTPFRSTTPMAVLMAHVNQEAPSLSSENPVAANVPRGLESIVMRLLQKNPERRFESATALRTALEAELQRLENPSATMQAPKQIVAPELSIGFDSTVGIEVPAASHHSPTASIEFASADRDQLDAPAPRKSTGLLALTAAIIVFATVGAAVALVQFTQQPAPSEATAIETPPLAMPAEDPIEVAAETPPIEEPPVEIIQAAEAVPAEEEPAAKTEPEKKKKNKKKKNKQKAAVEPAKTAEAEPVVVAEKPDEMPVQKPVEKPVEKPKAEDEPQTAEAPPLKKKVVGKVKEKIDKEAKGLSRTLESKMDDFFGD